MKKRESGILMPIYSLPSKYGCGSLGKEAFKFVDWLAKAGQSVWQILPLGPTNFGDSPYQSVSSFAGNPYFVNLEILAEEGLLNKADLAGLDFGSDPMYVDYTKLSNLRFEVLRKAYANGKDDPEFSEFKQAQEKWLRDYALYVSAKIYFGHKEWTLWPDEALKKHEPEALDKYSELLADEIDFYAFIQFKFFEQWDKLKAYANKKGIKIMGDIPVYVPMDSADVWAWTRFFDLDENYLPREVAGVPPDYFNEDGQLWNNPLYNWDAMRSDGFGWWIRRIDGSLRFVDTLRIDHFRGFASYWAIPYGDSTAKNGKWIPGPGMDFVGVLNSWFGQEKFVAEDLGIIGDDVKWLLSASGLPGMKVLEFAFDPDAASSYLPHNHVENCICYVGTHDNTTLAAWKEDEDPKTVAFAKEYLNIKDDKDFNMSFIRAGMASTAYLFIAQIQDYLGLGREARTNVPGTIGSNWRWRLLPGQLTGELAEKIARMTKIYGRENSIAE